MFLRRFRQESTKIKSFQEQNNDGFIFHDRIRTILPNNECPKKKYPAENRYNIQTTNDKEIKQRPIDRLNFY